jgi:hypothetical protein
MAVVVDEAVCGGLDALPAGPALSAALVEVDPAGLTGEEAAAWMRAWFRTRNHGDWALLVSIREACASRAGTTVRVELDEFAPKIAAASLGWSVTKACTRLDLAVAVLERLPALGERMRRGDLELDKAAAFVTGLDGLTAEQCAEVFAMLLDEARDLPIGQLRERILDAGYAVDPVWGANRLAAATARARVSTETNPSGAVNVCGRDLDPDLAAAAKARLRALALAVRARLRAAGRKVALGFIEARVFVRLMDGTQAGADDAHVITAVFTELTTTRGRHDPDDDGPDDTGPSDSGPSDSGPNAAGPDDGGPDDGGPDDGGPDEGGPGDGGGPDDGGPDDGGPDDTGSDDGRSDDPGSDEGGPDDRPTDDGADDGGTDGAGPVDGDGPADTGSEAGRGSAAQSVVFAPGAAVQLTLSTLLGLEDQPGTLTGIGPVPAATARAATQHHGAARWEILVHDDAGHLEHLLVLRAPPGTIRDPRHRRETIQVTTPAALLHALSPHHDETGEIDLPGARDVLFDHATTEWLHRARQALEASEAADPEEHPATTTRDRDRRLPSTRLARWVRARDQTCIGLGCSRPAQTCDLDHTLDWLLGGPTQADDLAALCRHDHRAKHEGGWRHQQPRPGQFLITDPTGTVHRTESRVTHPRPSPVTPGYAITPDEPPPRERGDWAPRRTRDGRITQQAHDTIAHLNRRTRAQQQQPPSRYDDDPDF